ncbi:hypothetical protein DPMN_054619 [Dreissena polymorpha]|uniref:Uncharacterized protein n=1 Tax=Dreissena polymorpha TaxID=45954 RepID=A0A9D4CQX5_DREPO|nr:hypothetical protein DPMN_054619 [Dreissena polymorpha]
MLTAAMARLSRSWTRSFISFPTKYRLFTSFVHQCSLNPTVRRQDLDASCRHRTQMLQNH